MVKPIQWERGLRLAGIYAIRLISQGIVIRVICFRSDETHRVYDHGCARFKTGEDPLNHNQVGFQSSAAVVDGTVALPCAT